MSTDIIVKNHNHKCERCTKPFACNGECKQYCERCEREKSEPQVSLTETIKNYPEMTEEEAKLLFIRKSAQEAFEKGEIEEATKGILKVMVEVTFVGNMTKEEIAQHIGNLERAKSYLAAFTQGLQIGYAREQEPIFKARAEKRRQEKLAEKLTSSKDRKVNELIEMARKLSLGEDASQTPKVKANKVKCEKCGNEVFSLKFHKC